MGTTDRLHRRALRRLYREHIAPLVGRPPRRFGPFTAPARHGVPAVDTATHVDAAPSYWQVRQRTTMRPADFVQLGVTDAHELAAALRRLDEHDRHTAAAPGSQEGAEERIRATVAVARRLRGRTGGGPELSATTYVMY